MGLLTYAQAVVLVDKLCAAYSATVGTSASGYGLGDGTFGTSLKAADLRAIIEGSSVSSFADADLESVLVPAVLNLASYTLADRVFGSMFASLIGSIDSVASRARTVSATITDLNTFLAWYNYVNASTYWQCLAPPDWRLAYAACKSGAFPLPKNVYYEVLKGASYRADGPFTNGLGKWVASGAGTGAATTAAFIIDPTKYAGGVAYALWESAITAGVLTVTGLDQSGAAETWVSASISGAASSAILVPQTHAYSLITKVTGISATGFGAAETIYVEARRPSGRTNPPT